MGERLKILVDPFRKYGTVAFLSVLSLAALYFISRYSYPLFHSFVDGVSIIVAVCVFVIIWNSRHLVDNNYFLYVGIGFLFFGILDFMHILGNKDMGIFTEYGNLGPALYIASRYILSISLLIAPLFINRKLNTTLMFAVYSLVTLIILVSIFYWQIFPVCFVEGVGLSLFKIVSDFIICLILLGAIGLLLVNRGSFDSRVLRLFVASIILSIATGLAFTLYTDAFGIMNMAGHLFQISSFYLVYLAIIEISLTKPQDILFRKLKQSENELLDLSILLKKKAVELEQANIRLQEVDRLKSVFLASMSHELRTPLNSIIGFTGIILNGMSGKINQEQRRQLTMVKSSGNHLLNLINDVLDLSKIEAGRVELLLEEMKLDDVVKDVAEAFSVAVSEKSLDLVAEVPVGISLFSDRRRVKQALMNLVSNAIKFTEKGSVKIVAGVVSAGNLEIRVIDTGIGINEEDMTKLFIPFQQVGTSGIKKHEGTGLGLYLVKRLMEILGGDVRAQSEYGRGSEFILTMPLKYKK